METLERLERYLGDIPGDVTEVRVRAGKRAQFRCLSGERLGEPVDAKTLQSMLSTLADHSLYARDVELRQGYFTMADGCRVGVCGRMLYDGSGVNGIASVGSICVRVSREIRGAADGFYGALFDGDERAVRSALIVSAPGLGKTTALRDAARRLSEDGFNVCIADERRELAACVDGVATLDVGPRTDVMDGCPKHIAVARLLRACAPQVIVTDEIGGRREAEALSEAARCGVAVLASAHAGSVEDLIARRDVDIGVFELAVLLAGAPGRVREIRAL